MNQRSSSDDLKSASEEPELSAEAIAARIEAQINLLRLSDSCERSDDEPDPLIQLRARQWVNSHVPIGWPQMPAGILPKIKAIMQKVARRLLRWYINPIVDQQNEFNDAAVLAMRDIHDQIHLVSKQATELEKDLGMLTRRQPAEHPRSLPCAGAALRASASHAELTMSLPSASPPKSLQPDRHDVILRRLCFAVELQGGAHAPVLVVTDGTDGLVSRARELGLAVDTFPIVEDTAGPTVADSAPAPRLCEYLETLEQASLQGFFWLEGLWRLSPAQCCSILAVAHKALVPGAPVLIESIDPGDASAVSRWIWSDPWAVRPYAPELVQQMLAYSGFEFIDESSLSINDDSSPNVFYVIAYRSQD